MPKYKKYYKVVTYTGSPKMDTSVYPADDQVQWDDVDILYSTCYWDMTAEQTAQSFASYNWDAPRTIERIERVTDKLLWEFTLIDGTCTYLVGFYHQKGLLPTWNIIIKK